RRAPLLAGGGLVAVGAAVTLLAWLLPNDGGDASADDSPTDGPADGSPTDGPADDGGGEGGGTVSIGVRFDQPGMSVLTPEGEPAGFDADVARYVAAELGYAEEDIDWVEAPAPERVTMLQTGEVDFLVAAFTITDERMTEVDFAGPYLSSRQDLLLRADDELTDVSELNDRVLCSVSGSTSARAVSDGLAPGVTLVEQATYGECLDALASGQVDAVTTDDATLAGYASAEPGVYRLAGLSLGGPYEYGVGVPKGETELADSIDAALARMVADGSWAESVETHFGGAEDYEPSPPVL
ncbi:transporter substrate-binding domain-containing protein, partial [Streptomyces sedi]